MAKCTNRPRPEALRALAETARVDVLDLERLTWGPDSKVATRFRGLLFPAKLTSFRGKSERRVCPECLETAPYHRAVWDLVCVAACPIHSRLLLDACRSCGEPLKWIGSDLRQCGRCLGGNLTRMRTDDVSAADIRGTRVVYGLLGEQSFGADAANARTLLPFRDLGDASTVEFLFRIGLELVGSRRKLFSVEHPGELAWQAHLALSRGLELAESWPGAFERTLEAMRRRSPPGTQWWQALQNSVGSVERWLARLPPGQGAAIREVCRDYRARIEQEFRVMPMPTRPKRKPRPWRELLKHPAGHLPAPKKP